MPLLTIRLIGSEGTPSALAALRVYIARANCHRANYRPVGGRILIGQPRRRESICDAATPSHRIKNVRRLQHVLKDVNALLPLEVYGALYEIANTEKPRQIVEIGTAHGAATIALGLGLSDANSSGHIWTVDCFEASDAMPSSRARFGDKSANVKIVESNFRKADVQHLISLFIGSSEDFEREKLIGSIDMLVLDADGRIDRDLLLFRNSLVADAIVAIDDIDGAPRLIRNQGKTLTDLKHGISNRLLETLVVHQYLRIEKIIGNTAFCRAQNPRDWDVEDFLRLSIEAYRLIVFTKSPAKAVFWMRIAVRKVDGRIPIVSGVNYVIKQLRRISLRST